MGRPRRSDQTSATLRRDITDGRFMGGSVLPGERQLALSLQVSRTTLRRALAELIEEGLLSQRHGLGTVVNTAREQTGKKPLNVPAVYNGLNGRIDRVAELSRGCLGASMDEAMAFGIPPTQDVFGITRILFIGDRADAVEYACAPLPLLPDLSTIEHSLSAAVSRQGHSPVTRLRRLRSGVLSREDATHLGTDLGAAAICVHEAFFTSEGRCCLLNRAFYSAARFDAVFSTSLATGDLPPV